MLSLTEQNISDIVPAPALWFDVTITETLEQIVRVEAHGPEEAEQIVAKEWEKGKLVLDAENFTCVEFAAVPVEDVQKN